MADEHRDKRLDSIQDFQSQSADLRKRLIQVHIQREHAIRDEQSAALSAHALQELSVDRVAYRAIGRCFIQTTKPGLMEHLLQEGKNANEMNKNVTELESQLRTRLLEVDQQLNALVSTLEDKSGAP